MKEVSKKNQRGQIHISLGMIFSIILIIIFIGFAVFAIQKFLGIQDNIKLNQFYDGFQNDINKVWNAEQTTEQKSYILPSSITKICFVSKQGDNMIIYGPNSIPSGSKNIDNINIANMTSNGNLCFDSVKGKVSFVIEKEFSDTLVTIKS